MKKREIPEELRILRSLNSRMSLSEEEQRLLASLEKGSQGEEAFDQLTEDMGRNVILLHDLCLEHQHSTFQVDTLMISQKNIFLVEVKNYAGEYLYEKEGIRPVSSQHEITNPLHQLSRSQTLLRSLLKQLGYPSIVGGAVVFVNPEFTLFQAPLNSPIILPTQLPRFIDRWRSTPLPLHHRHKELAQQLINRHMTKNRHSRTPVYQYGELNKGLLCFSCYSFEMQIAGRSVTCENCSEKEDTEEAIMRSVAEFQLLFPERKISTPQLQEWCGGLMSAKAIRRVLTKNFKSVGDHRHRYYV